MFIFVTGFVADADSVLALSFVSIPSYRQKLKMGRIINYGNN